MKKILFHTHEWHIFLIIFENGEKFILFYMTIIWFHDLNSCYAHDFHLHLFIFHLPTIPNLFPLCFILGACMWIYEQIIVPSCICGCYCWCNCAWNDAWLSIDWLCDWLGYFIVAVVDVLLPLKWAAVWAKNSCVFKWDQCNEPKNTAA